jgi:hypothetical protein
VKENTEIISAGLPNGRPVTTVRPFVQCVSVASVKSGISRPHNLAGQNERLRTMHQPSRAIGMPISAKKIGAKLAFIFELDHFSRLNAYSLHHFGHLTLWGVRVAFRIIR